MLRFFLLVCLASSSLAIKFGLNVELAPTPTEDQINAARVGSDKFTLYSIPMNWFQGFEFCLQRGERLASLVTEADHLALTELIRTESTDGEADYWTSGSDLGTRDKYVWMSTGKTFTFTDWADGEPNHTKKNGDEERCVDLRSKYQYKFNDEICSEKHFIACEKDV